MSKLPTAALAYLTAVRNAVPLGARLTKYRVDTLTALAASGLTVSGGANPQVAINYLVANGYLVADLNGAVTLTVKGRNATN